MMAYKIPCSLACLLLLAWPGCSSDDPDDATRCTPGATLTCVCPSGGQGKRECLPDTQKWGPCQGCSTSDGGGQPKTGSRGGDCYRDKTCDAGLMCKAGVCVKQPADASPADGPGADRPKPDAPKADAPKPDAPKPDAPKPDQFKKPDLLKPDQKKDPCAGALFNGKMYIGNKKTVTSGGQQVDLEMSDIGSSSSAPAALIKIDGSLSILNVGQSDTSKAGFEVYVANVQNQGDATQRWAQICVSSP